MRKVLQFFLLRRYNYASAGCYHIMKTVETTALLTSKSHAPQPSLEEGRGQSSGGGGFIERVRKVRFVDIAFSLRHYQVQGLRAASVVLVRILNFHSLVTPV